MREYTAKPRRRMWGLPAALALSLACTAEEPQPLAEIAAWEAFCDQLKSSGAALLREHAQTHEVDRAEGAVYLAQQAAAAVKYMLVQRDRHQPLLRIGATTLDKWGLDGADVKYQGAAIDAEGDYLLHGQLGNARLFAVQLSAMFPRYTAFASLSAEELAPGADGRFSLRISRERPAGWKGPWLPLNPRATDVLVREYFHDWESERPSALQIERLDAAPVPGPLGLEEAAKLLADMGTAFEQRAPMWLGRSQQLQRHALNRFRQAPQNSGGQGLRDNLYATAWYRVAPGEALLIELDAPDALMWSFQLGNYWWESLDYLNHSASLNGHQAHRSADGRYRLVIALEDPGVPNWLDPSGHPEGLLLYRAQRATRAPSPRMEVLPLAALRSRLPADTPAVSPEARRAERTRRLTHAARRWSP